MSRTARFGSTSLAALCLAVGALTAAAEEARRVPRPAPKPVVRVVGLVPAADAQVHAALLRGIEKALKEAQTPTVRWVLHVSAAPGRWSNAGPATVRLLFTHRAQVLITPPDRRVAHLMTQVATRVRVPLVTTSSAKSVATTGSKVLKTVEYGKPSGKAQPKKDKPTPDWEAIGYRAGRQAVTLRR